MVIVVSMDINYRNPTGGQFSTFAFVVLAFFAIAAPGTTFSGEILKPQPAVVLSSFFDSQATAMLDALLTGPSDLNTLSVLSARYEETGFQAASQLFGISSRVLCGEAPEVYEIQPSGFPFDCNRVVIFSDDKRAPPDPRERMRVAREVTTSSALLGPADPGGVSLIESTIADNNRTCELLVEWAVAVLRLSIHNDGWVDRGRQELAVRLLTSLASNHFFPIDYVGPGNVYLLLTRFFASQGDFVTALGAANIAAYHAKGHPPSGWIDPSSLERLIEEAVAGLEAEVSSDRSNLGIGCPEGK